MQKMQKSRKYCLYVHTNKTNGKKYFGITRQNPERRWQKGHGYDGTYFGNAIAKYGWEGFNHEIVFEGLTKEQACSLEISMIAKHKTNNRDFGYNIAEGGQTCDCLAGQTGEKHPNHQRVKMIDPETGVVLRVFGAQSEAARELGISRKGITKACRGKGIVTYKGYIWEYADKKYKKPKNPGVGNYDHSVHKKRVCLFELNGNEFVFESVKEASEKTGVSRSNISRYLSGTRKDGSGRRWCYA